MYDEASAKLLSAMSVQSIRQRHRLAPRGVGGDRDWTVAAITCVAALAGLTPTRSYANESRLLRGQLAHIRAVAFDAYGTLVRPVRSTWYREIRASVTAKNARSGYHRLMTTNREITPATLSDFFSVSENTAAEAIRQIQAEVSSVELFDETPRALTRLSNAGFPMVVVSNLGQPWAEPLRRQLSPWIKNFVFSFEVGVTKPDDGIFDAASAALAYRRNQMLMVGDNKRNDVRGASAAGLTSIHLDRTEGATLEATKETSPARINQIAQLLEVLPALE